MGPSWWAHDGPKWVGPSRAQVGGPTPGPNGWAQAGPKWAQARNLGPQKIPKNNDTSVDPKQQYISRLSKTCVYKAGHGVSSCSLWSMPSEHGASSWGIIMGHLYRFMGHHHLEHEHAQANAACNNATSNCSSERPSHVVFHAGHYFGHYFGRFFHAGHQSIVTSMQPLRASSFGA